MTHKTAVGIIHYSVSPVVGGVESVIYAQAKALAELGYPVTVFAGRGEASAQPPDVNFVHLPLADSIHKEIAKINTKLEKGQIPENFQAVVNRLMEELEPSFEKIDVLIAHNILSKHFNLALSVAVINLLDAGSIRRLIAWGHDFTWTSSHSRNLVHPGYPWDILRKYDPRITYVTVSHKRQEEWADLLGCPIDEIHVIYNGVDPKVLLGLSDKIEGFANHIHLWDANLIILLPVRITQAKNIETALQVTKELMMSGCKVKMIISGPPDPHDRESMEYYRSLLDQKKELGLEQEVFFAYDSGFTTGEPLLLSSAEASELFRISDLVLMPSHREGYGMPVLEAGLVGIPIFSTPIPAAEEIGAPDVMIFPKDATPSYISEMILTWMDGNPIHSLKQRVRSGYTWKAIAESAIAPLISGTEVQKG